MTQPKFVPVTPSDRVRKQLRPDTPDRWRADRPAEIASSGQPRGDHFGNIGPDQGYALKLAKALVGKLQREKDEHEDDIIVGCLGVALKRASIYGRAPVIHDWEFAFTVWGYMGGAPDDLVTFRKRLFAQASHHYEAQRDIVDHVREDAYGMSTAEVRAQLHDWTAFIDANLAPHVNKRTEAMKLLADVGGTDEGK